MTDNKMKCPKLLIVIVLSVLLRCDLTFSIEVHEDSNEESNELAPEPLKSTLPNSNANLAGNDNRPSATVPGTNEPGKQPPVPMMVTTDSTSSQAESPNHHHQHHQHHHHKQHSPTYRDAPLSITATAATSSSSSSASSTTEDSSSGSPAKEEGGNGQDVDQRGGTTRNHLSGGYKKRQLNTNVFQQPRVRKNETNERSFDKQQKKQFVPSPEVHFYSQDDSQPRLPNHGHHQVDAPFPANAVNGDSKWFATHQPHFPTSSFEHETKSAERPVANHDWPSKFEQHKNGKLLWLPNDRHPHESDTPFSHSPPKPKGKWKWVPEEEEHGSITLQDDRNLESVPDVENKLAFGQPSTTFSKGQGHSFQGHPYSFDGIPASSSGSSGTETPFSGGGGSSAPGEGTNGVISSGPFDYFFGSTGHESKLKMGGKGENSLKKVSPWKKLVHVLTAAIPIGLIISALTPQVVYVNPNMTIPPVQMQTPTPISTSSAAFTIPNRQRSEDGTNAFHGFLHALTSMTPWSGAAGGSCEEKSFCEMTRLGMNHDADILYKMLWKIANETPEERARQSGLEEMFRAIRENNCASFVCEGT
ncbi:uncharacterized protein LOC129748959 [Uranotaenia lowii]|uniref:uncharacterized protein LOC129748959 n=1 Tax=Uranotaenia lowii TaxID=190385 RepID=UPI00247A5CBE|nr:uncharacterized protein LOC129748959 [Uranotaenia lowii]